MSSWTTLVEKIKQFGTGFGSNWLTYFLQLILLSILYYLIFKILKNNKANKFIGLIVFFIDFSEVVDYLT